MNRLRWLKRVAVDLPRNLELTYCLLRDPRMPVARKGTLLAALAFIASPIDLPAWVPIIGEADLLLLTLIATGVFVDTAPPELVEEHRQLIAEHRSAFDRDVERGRRVALMIAGRVKQRGAVGEVAGTPVDGATSVPEEVSLAS